MCRYTLLNRCVYSLLLLLFPIAEPSRARCSSLTIAAADLFMDSFVPASHFGLICHSFICLSFVLPAPVSHLFVFSSSSVLPDLVSLSNLSFLHLFISVHPLFTWVIWLSFCRSFFFSSSERVMQAYPSCSPMLTVHPPFGSVDFPPFCPSVGMTPADHSVP